MWVKIDHLISISIFAKALADYFWTKSEEFDPKLTKTIARTILKDQLRQKGYEGIETYLWEGASEEFVEPHNRAYTAAIEWINKHYPSLKE